MTQILAYVLLICSALATTRLAQEAVLDCSTPVAATLAICAIVLWLMVIMLLPFPSNPLWGAHGT